MLNVLENQNSTFCTSADGFHSCLSRSNFFLFNHMRMYQKYWFNFISFQKISEWSTQFLRYMDEQSSLFRFHFKVTSELVKNFLQIIKIVRHKGRPKTFKKIWCPVENFIIEKIKLGWAELRTNCAVKACKTKRRKFFISNIHCNLIHLN